jgi:hypothetical protein
MSEIVTNQDVYVTQEADHDVIGPIVPAQNWSFKDFSSVQAALTFLNTMTPSPAPGDISAIARNNGSVGMFYKLPPSAPLGFLRAWHYKNFPTTAAALAFLDQPASLGKPEGTVSANARNDGTVGMFYVAVELVNHP